MARKALLAIAASATLGTASCSEQDTPTDVRQPVTTAIAKLQKALVGEDWHTICRHLNEPAQEQAGSVGHGLPTTSCARDVRRAFGIIERGGGWSPAKPVVSRVGSRDEQATATVDSGRWKAYVPFVSRGDNWKLAGFFGASPAAVGAIEKTSRGRPFPKPAGKPVAALDKRGQPCAHLDDEAYPEISGGCTLRFATKSAPIRILTPFGNFKFADCRIFYRVSVDAAGRTWTDGWGAADIDKPGCSDVDPCKAGPFDLHPWKGRLVGDGKGGFLHVMDMCMRTCVGAFTGKLVMHLTRHGDRWRAEQTDEGASGFKIDGPLTTAGDGFDLRG